MGTRPLVELLAAMSERSLEQSDLDPTTLGLVRLAALVASDAPPAAYAASIDASARAGLGAGNVQEVLVAIAPIVGTARVIAGASGIAEALGIELAAVPTGDPAA